MENDEHFHRAFMYFDTDGSGYIELDELRDTLVDESGETDADVLNEIMREVDTDKVSYLHILYAHSSSCAKISKSLWTSLLMYFALICRMVG